MLSIRFQRTGRRGQAKFRVVVQDSRRSPTSGRVVANLGHYNPHSKESGVDFDRLVVYLKNGAQPSSRVVNLLTTNKIDLPAWVKTPAPRQRPIRNPEKLRRNRPPEAETSPAEAEAADESPPDSQNPEASRPEDQTESDTPAEKPAEPQAEATTEAEPPKETDKAPNKDPDEPEAADQPADEAKPQPPKADETADPEAKKSE